MFVNFQMQAIFSLSRTTSWIAPDRMTRWQGLGRGSQRWPSPTTHAVLEWNRWQVLTHCEVSAIQPRAALILDHHSEFSSQITTPMTTRRVDEAIQEPCRLRQVSPLDLCQRIAIRSKKRRTSEKSKKKRRLALTPYMQCLESAPLRDNGPEPIVKNLRHCGVFNERQALI